MLRLVAYLLALVMTLPLAAPVFAGTAEANFLSRIAGSWSGKGNMQGGETGPISCRLDFKASGARLNYVGRCTVQDFGGQGFNGAITYNDSTRRYEVRSANGLVVGVRRGNAIVFTTKTQSLSGSAYSTMTVSPSSITISFSFVRNGEKTTSRVVFSK